MKQSGLRQEDDQVCFNLSSKSQAYEAGRSAIRPLAPLGPSCSSRTDQKENCHKDSVQMRMGVIVSSMRPGSFASVARGFTVTDSEIVHIIL